MCIRDSYNIVRFSVLKLSFFVFSQHCPDNHSSYASTPAFNCFSLSSSRLLGQARFIRRKLRWIFDHTHTVNQKKIGSFCMDSSLIIMFCPFWLFIRRCFSLRFFSDVCPGRSPLKIKQRLPQQPLFPPPWHQSWKKKWASFGRNIRSSPDQPKNF